MAGANAVSHIDGVSDPVTGLFRTHTGFTVQHILISDIDVAEYTGLIAIEDAMEMPRTPSPTRGALETALELIRKDRPLPQAATTPVPALITRYGREGLEYD